MGELQKPDSPDDVLTIQWSCEMNVGPSRWYWSGDWVFGPAECMGEGEIEVTREDCENQEFPAQCTECGQPLDPFCDHFVAPDGTTSGAVHRKLFN